MSQEMNPGQKQEMTSNYEDQKKTGFFTRPRAGGKSFWAWMRLLLIPMALFVVGASFSYFQTQTSLQVSQKQYEDNQNRASDQQQATILQTYLDNIQDLLIHNNLQNSPPGKEVAILARARTVTALQRLHLDSQRKGVLVQFLYEANLIGYSDRFALIIHPPIIILFGADLTEANLADAPLSGADLIETYLSKAHLVGADLSEAELGEAHLESADLRGAYLSGAELYGAYLNGDKLGNVHLENADLRGADLRGADLRGADLRGADLFDTNLSGTDITQQQLDQVKSCRNAILPNRLTCMNFDSHDPGGIPNS